MLNKDQLKIMQRALSLMLDDDATRAEMSPSEIAVARGAYAGLDPFIDGNMIADYWSTDDVYELGKDEDGERLDAFECTPEQARRTLQLMEESHDAQYGYNWDTLRDAWETIKNETPKERLEYLRGEIKAERISTAEIAELQSLVKHIDPSDVLLLEWAGVPEGGE